MNLWGTQWRVLHCRQHALCHSYWASLSFLFCNPNEISGKWQDLSFPKPPPRAIAALRATGNYAESRIWLPCIFLTSSIARIYLPKSTDSWHISLAEHYWVDVNEAALPNALIMEPLFATSLWSRPTSFIHKWSWDVWWKETPWASAGFQCSCLPHHFSTLQCNMVWVWVWVWVETATISQRLFSACRMLGGNPGIVFNFNSWMVTGQSLAILITVIQASNTSTIFQVTDAQFRNVVLAALLIVAIALCLQKLQFLSCINFLPSLKEDCSACLPCEEIQK